MVFSMVLKTKKKMFENSATYQKEIILVTEL